MITTKIMVVRTDDRLTFQLQEIYRFSLCWKRVLIVLNLAGNSADNLVETQN